MSRNEPTELMVAVHHNSPEGKAVLVSIDGENVRAKWIPKSFIESIDLTGKTTKGTQSRGLQGHASFGESRDPGMAGAAGGADLMVGKSPIEWTQETWNPIVGCSILSPGCTNCYAMKMAARIEAINLEARAKGKPHAPQYDGTTKTINGNAVWTGKLALAGDNILLAPLKRKKPTTYFVNSMGDLFHEACPDEWIDLVLAVGAICPQHTLQILTKRAARMHAYMTTLDRKKIIAARVMDLSNKLARESGHAARIKLDHFSACFAGSGPFKNIWLGVSTERQQEADERVPLLLQTPAAVRFISAEPLLSRIDLSTINTASTGYSTTQGAKLDWVIVGGESGPNARPMHPDWARSLRDQCAVAGVPFFFKQWGEHAPAKLVDEPWRSEEVSVLPDGRVREWDTGEGRLVHPDMASMRRVGKKRAGRRLDGSEYNEMPGRG